MKIWLGVFTVLYVIRVLNSEEETEDAVIEMAILSFFIFLLIEKG